MTAHEKRVLGAMAAAVVVVGSALVVALFAHRGGHQRVAAGATATTTTSVTAPPTSLGELRPVDTAPPSTAPPPTTAPPTTAPPTTAPPTTTTTAPPKPVVTGDGAVLVRPAVLTTKQLDPSAPCSKLLDQGWSGTCDRVVADGGDIVWVVEQRPASGGATSRRAAVWHQVDAAGTWEEKLAAADDAGAQWSSVAERTADVDGDGRSEVAFGFRHQGTGQILDVDVVKAPGDVVVHRQANKGSARIPAGELDVWTANVVPGEATCCPSSYQHEVIKFAAGAWRLWSSERVDPSSVPPSQL